MQRILAGGATLGDTVHEDERPVACRALSAVEIRARPPGAASAHRATRTAEQAKRRLVGPTLQFYGKRCQCRVYGCWGKLIPMERDSAGRDMRCKDCGCPDWSDPRRI
jgi:hypothetical protein